jgi:hypothetical protein
VNVSHLIGFNLPNLDGLDQNDLREAKNEFTAQLESVNAQIEKLRQHKRILAIARNYVTHKRTGMIYRTHGDICKALEHETRADILYSKIPAPYRW